MVNVSTMVEPADLPRGDAMRRLLTAGCEQMLVEGYRYLPAHKHSLRKKKVK